MYKNIASFIYIFVVLSVSFVVTSGNDMKEDDMSAHSDRGGLWFGPRLGKRSLQMPDENNRDLYHRLLDAADTLRFYYDQLPDSLLAKRNEPEARVTKKVIFTPKLGRSLGEERQYVDFTPRLGRHIAEDAVATTPDQDAYQGDVDRIGLRTRYFSPRLGRNINFSPRLGRQLTDDNYENVRVVRSVNDTKTSRR